MTTSFLHRIFWTVCLPVRLTIAALVLTLLPPTLVTLYMKLTAAGFLCNALLTLVGRKTRGGLGGVVWWNEVRWVHIALWVATSVLSSQRVPWAGWLLVADVVVGALVRLVTAGGGTPSPSLPLADTRARPVATGGARVGAVGSSVASSR